MNDQEAAQIMTEVSEDITNAAEAGCRQRLNSRLSCQRKASRSLLRQQTALHAGFN